MKRNHGWFGKMQSVLRASALLISVFSSSMAAAESSLSIREITITGKNQIEIQFDGVLAKNSLNLDYVRDNIQFSFHNATIYPAKMIHAEDSTFNKIFAYQYSPNLVRIRFTVDGQAEVYKGKMRWTQHGKVLAITFPEAIAAAPAPVKRERVEKTAEKNNDNVIDEQKERTLLSRVLGGQKSALDESHNSNESAAAPLVEHTTKKNNPSPQLAGAKSGSSAGHSFFMMILVVGGLGAVLFVVKKKKRSLQAKIVGNTWWSNLLPSSMRKPKSFIEVMGQHALGPKQSIVVVKIKGQQFVLGVTQDNVQLITQLDADEAEVDVLGDPAVSESIGKMFGARPTAAPVTRTSPESFEALVKSSTGAGAIIGRNAYQQQQNTPTQNTAPMQNYSTPKVQPSIRDQIRRRLENQGTEGMRNA